MMEPFTTQGQTAPRGAVMVPAAWINEQFVAPGAPRGVWVGVRMQLGA